MAWRYTTLHKDDARRGNTSFTPGMSEHNDNRSLIDSSNEDDATEGDTSHPVYSKDSKNIDGARAFLRSNATRTLWPQRGDQDDMHDDDLSSHDGTWTALSAVKQPKLTVRESVMAPRRPVIHNRNVGSLSAAPASGKAVSVTSRESCDTPSYFPSKVPSTLVMPRRARARPQSVRTSQDLRTYDEDDPLNSCSFENDMELNDVNVELRRATQSLLDNADPRLLDEDFVPAQHVLKIVVKEDGTEASLAQINELLLPYYQLQEEIDKVISGYIESHGEEFKGAICSFSEMVLAVSDSDEVLARLKQGLAMAIGSLDGRGEELHVLRMRAAKALLMEESLRHLEMSLSCEAEVEHLISTRHYLAALRLLQQQKARLDSPDMINIRATQGMRDFVNKTLDTLHTNVLDDLMGCVFEKHQYNEENIESMSRMMDEGMLENVAGTQSLSEESHGPWRLSRCLVSGVSRRTHGGCALLDNDVDDPSNEALVENSLNFIPLCVRTLKELGKLDLCCEAFVSCALRSIEHCAASFLSLYGYWRSEVERSKCVGGEDNKGSTVRVVKLRGGDLASTIISYEEAVALLQQNELGTLLNALFMQLERIVCNANYLVETVVKAYFPFLTQIPKQSDISDIDFSSHEWDVTHTPLRTKTEMRNIVTKILSDAIAQHSDASSSGDGGESPELVALKQIMVNFDVDHLINLNSSQEPRASKRCNSAESQNSGEAAGDRELPNNVSLSDVLNALSAAAFVAMEKTSQITEDIIDCRDRLSTLISTSVREAFRSYVQEIYFDWDLRALSSQLSFTVERIFQLICADDSTMNEKDNTTEVSTDKQAIKHYRTTSRSWWQSEASSGIRVSETFSSLDKMLSSYGSSGLLSIMEQSGLASFSIITSAKTTERDQGKMQERRKRSIGIESHIVVEERVEESVEVHLRSAAKLQNWFVFTPMNVLTCYECVGNFFRRCSFRELRFADKPLNEINDYFLGFFESTYAPSLRVFHTTQLRRLMADMSESHDADEVAVADVVTQLEEGNHKNGVSSPTLAAKREMHHLKAQQEYMRWPTVTLTSSSGGGGGSEGYPVLSCVHYVGQVVQKMSHICFALSEGLVGKLQQYFIEPFLMELAVFLKKKVQRITRGSISHWLLNGKFEDAFRGTSSFLWDTLCGESLHDECCTAVDEALFQYYKYINAKRTPAGPGNEIDVAILEEMCDLFNAVKERIGSCKGNNEKMDDCVSVNSSFALGHDARNTTEKSSMDDVTAADLALQGDGIVVALALFCYSTEWLCGVILRAFDPSHAWKHNNDDKMVPGTDCCGASQPDAETSGTSPCPARWEQLRELVRQLYTISQACLFHLFIEARFTAFQFIPQLSEHSYNIVAGAGTADTFVHAYNRRMSNFFALLKPHLPPKRVKYTCLTVAKPLSDLFMMEVTQLRNKIISPAGIARLQMNLLAMEAALQLALPTDDDLRESVKLHFVRPATFIRYLPNKNVADDLVASGDYKLFNIREMEELVRLVFKTDTGSGAALEQIKLLHSGLKREISDATPSLAASPALSPDKTMSATHSEVSRNGGKTFPIQNTSTDATQGRGSERTRVAQSLPDRDAGVMRTARHVDPGRGFAVDISDVKVGTAEYVVEVGSQKVGEPVSGSIETEEEEEEEEEDEEYEELDDDDDDVL
uniref:Exocyst complex component Sec8 n=1 Tax=Trypanosoma congolense (strain IL3000) TaxID=1068625 RepID=G0UV69_TRYCI|nr:conserved hypothetical protein [Trypanosoma congolense IL3000]